MLHAGIQHKTHVGRNRTPSGGSPRRQPHHRLGKRGGPRREPPLLHPHLNATLSTASLILLTITPASSVPCLPLNPFIAATIPTISSETSRIKPTYSTVPWARSPSSRARITRSRSTAAAWIHPIKAC